MAKFTISLQLLHDALHMSAATDILKIGQVGQDWVNGSATIVVLDPALPEIDKHAEIPRVDPIVHDCHYEWDWNLKQGGNDAKDDQAGT